MIDIKADASNFKLVAIEDIHLNPDNNNFHSDEQVDHLVEQFKFQGYRDPLIISSRSGFVICGEGRFLAAKKAGMTHLPASYQHFDSEDQEYAFLTAHNATARWSEMDFSKINTKIGEFGPDFNLDMLGIKHFTIQPMGKFEMEDELQEDMNKSLFLR